MKIIFLGTSSAVASSQRDNTCLLIKTQKDTILVDCPGAIVNKLERLGMDYRKISHIFFSHCHPDHIYGIISLLHSQYRLGNKLYIYAHPGVIKIIDALRRLFKLEDITQFPEVIVHNIKPTTKGIIYTSAELQISAFKVRHSRESLGFKFLLKKNNKTIVFSGDTSFCPSLVREAYACDYLIHDCFSPERFFRKYPELYKMHTSSLSLGKIAYACQAKSLVPIHFACEVKYSMSEIVREIKKSYSGGIIIPRDLGELKL